MENSLTSKTISYLRFPLMVGIVLIHFNISEGFALHVLIMHDLGSIVFSPMRSGSPYVLILFYFFIPALTILICLGLYKLLKKYLPGAVSLLTGGR